MARGFLDVLFVFRKFPVAGHVHRPGVGLGLALDHPFGQRLAHAAALKKPRHHRAGAPIAAFAWDRANKRISVGTKGESAVDPGLDAHILNRRIA